MASNPITSWQINGETVQTVIHFIFLGSKIIADGDCSHEIKRYLLLRAKATTNLDSILKKQRHYFTDKDPYSQSYGFSSSHVRMWELDHKESWAPKNWCFWTAVLEKTLESHLDCKEIKSMINWKSVLNIHWKEWCWSLSPILRPPDVKNWLIGKDPDAGKDWRQEEKGMTDDEMVGRRHWLDGHEFEQVLWVGDGQGSLVCCSPWGHRVGHD